MSLELAIDLGKRSFHLHGIHPQAHTQWARARLSDRAIWKMDLNLAPWEFKSTVSNLPRLRPNFVRDHDGPEWRLDPKTAIVEPTAFPIYSHRFGGRFKSEKH